MHVNEIKVLPKKEGDSEVATEVDNESRPSGPGLVACRSLPDLKRGKSQTMRTIWDSKQAKLEVEMPRQKGHPLKSKLIRHCVVPRPYEFSLGTMTLEDSRVMVTEPETAEKLQYFEIDASVQGKNLNDVSMPSSSLSFIRVSSPPKAQEQVKKPNLF